MCIRDRTNTVINSLAAGSYTVIGSDIMGCRDTIHTIRVDEPLKLMANIISDDYSICRNDTVQLSSSFSGGIKPYDISWSTGTTSVAVNSNSLTQIATPQSGTQYWFDLRDKNNCAVHSNTIEINVNQLPVIDFMADKIKGCQPLEVNFTNQSAATPSVTSWLWSFGTGLVSTAGSPNYTYTFPGTFNVSLKATTDSGCVATLTKQNHILVHPKPKANFNYTPPFGIDSLNPEVAFENTSIGYDNSLWSFNDGSMGTTETHPTHSYADTGVYYVKLVVSTVHNLSLIHI